MECHHPTKFDGNKYCGNELVVEEGNFTRSRLNPLLLLSVKHLTCYARMHDNLE